MKIIQITVLLVCIILGTNPAFSQKGHGHSNGPKANSRGNKGSKIEVKNGSSYGSRVRKSVYRPVKIGVYHPHWKPNHAYNRRWVYFPRHNFYWDNWRQGYYYRNGDVWVFDVIQPAVIVNVSLANEPNYELKQDEDDLDDIYIVNDKHKTVYSVK
jgi:hypothetical protein